jgi:DNA-binding SARP family transcriptional activator
MSNAGPSFDLLGPLQLTVADTPLSLGTPKQRAVLAMLLINRNHVVGTESLINASWGEEPAPAARASIHTYISNLRKLLNSAFTSGQGMLGAAPPGYRLTVARGACDLDRFTAEKTAGIRAAAASQFHQASTHLSTALSQWRGPVLEDLRDFGFVEVFAAALAEDRALVQTARAEAEIACGNAGAIIGELESLVAEHSYREPLWAQLITAYYLTERQSDALAAFQRLKATLADELGIDPGPTLLALHQKILRQEPLQPKQIAKVTAVRATRTVHATSDRAAGVGMLRNSAGASYQLRATVTRIGRLADNDIVLDNAEVSRRHAVIIDTGSSFVITDLGSANGVYVQGSAVRPSTTLTDGDVINICDHQFTFAIALH